MTTVTAVTAFLRAGAVCKTSSRSSWPSRGAGPKVKGPYLGVEIAARQYNPNPLTFGPRRTLAGWGERLCLSPLPNGECQSLGGVQGALFKGRPCWGSRPQTAGATPPIPLGRAHGTFAPTGRKCHSGLLHFRRSVSLDDAPYHINLQSGGTCLWQEATALTVLTQGI